MVVYKDSDFFRGTDYTAEDVKDLLAAGAIPKVFIEDFPDGSTQLNGVIELAMKRFPKSQQGDNWIQAIGDVLHALANDPDAMKTIEKKSTEYVKRNAVDTQPQTIESVYYDKNELAVMLKTDADKLHKLLHWVFTEHEGEFHPWIIEDAKLGYMVSLPLINQFKRQSQNFENYLKDIVSGRVKLERRTET